MILAVCHTFFGNEHPFFESKQKKIKIVNKTKKIGKMW